MTDNEAMVLVIENMLKGATNKLYIEQLENIVAGIKGYKHIEETKSPRYMSLLFWGVNIFPFSMKEYFLIANEIQNKDS